MMQETSGKYGITETSGQLDYSHVVAPARVAIYDDLLSSPQIIDIEPDSTREFINSLATTVYNASKSHGGEIPFSIILQVAENFIHARFAEVVVSVLDSGNTIRFADQGPGISNKEKAQQPGYSSATAPMKEIIHGVGSGLPIVREYMETKNGIVQIEDNIDTGAVITISLNGENKVDSHGPITEIPTVAMKHRSSDMATAALSPRALSILTLFEIEEIWGVKDISEELHIPLSSTHAELKKLEEAGMIAKLGKKRILTDLGARVVEDIA